MNRITVNSAILALSTILTSTGLQAAPAGLEHAIAVQEANTDRLLAIQGVVGTAVGTDNENVPIIKILTKTAGIKGLPENIEGFRVVPMVTGEIFARKRPQQTSQDTFDTTAKYRPAFIGISTGHPTITAGTIGARITDGTSFYALSNNHVYADINNATIGDPVIQPGTYDGGTLYDFEPMVFCNPYPNNCPANAMDAAIAITNSGNVANSTPPDGYGIPNSVPVLDNQIVPGMRVQKYGRTTKLTSGRIDSTNGTVHVCYDSSCLIVAKFTGQIIVKPGTFSAGGDSGSLIVEKTRANRPVGLLFAGSSSITIANPINTVLDRFAVQIDGQ
jgi:hypothetical protein